MTTRNYDAISAAEISYDGRPPLPTARARTGGWKLQVRTTATR